MTIAQLTVGEFGNPQIRRFLHELQASGFEGEVDATHATRTVLATDNSIYQRYPRAVVFPRHAKDVQRLASLLAREAFRVRRAQFEGFDLLLRLHTKFDRKARPAASSAGLKALCRGEIETLLEKAAREVTRRAGALPATPATSARTPCATQSPAPVAEPARDQAGKDLPPDHGNSRSS